MFRLLAHIVVNFLLLNAVAIIIPGIELGDWLSVTLFLIVLSLLNWFVVPIVRVITIPITIVTFGLFNLVITLVTTIVAINLSNGIRIEALGLSYLFLVGVITVVLSLGNGIVSSFVGK